MDIDKVSRVAAICKRPDLGPDHVVEIDHTVALRIADLLRKLFAVVGAAQVVGNLVHAR